MQKRDVTSIGIIFMFSIFISIIFTVIIIDPKKTKDVTDKINFYKDISEKGLFYQKELLQYCNDNEYYFNYLEDERIFEVKVGDDTVRINVEDGIFYLPKDEEVENSIFLDCFPNKFEDVKKYSNSVNYYYKNIEKVVKEDKNGKEEVSYIVNIPVSEIFRNEKKVIITFFVIIFCIAFGWWSCYYMIHETRAR